MRRHCAVICEFFSWTQFIWTIAKYARHVLVAARFLNRTLTVGSTPCQGVNRGERIQSISIRFAASPQLYSPPRDAVIFTGNELNFLSSYQRVNNL